MSFHVTMDMKRAFFDRQAVIDAVERVEHRAMSKSLAYIRTAARTRVLRRRKKSSAPGSPPSVHSTSNVATLRNIWFFYDKRRSSGVVGPVKTNGSRVGSTTVPALLEGGGSYMQKTGTLIKVASGERDKRGRFIKDKFRRLERARTVRIQPRPFMQVALDREAQNGNVVSAWANVVSN